MQVSHRLRKFPSCSLGFREEGDLPQLLLSKLIIKNFQHERTTDNLHNIMVMLSSYWCYFYHVLSNDWDLEVEYI